MGLPILQVKAAEKMTGLNSQGYLAEKTQRYSENMQGLYYHGKRERKNLEAPFQWSKNSQNEHFGPYQEFGLSLWLGIMFFPKPKFYKTLNKHSNNMNKWQIVTRIETRYTVPKKTSPKNCFSTSVRYYNLLPECTLEVITLSFFWVSES